MHIASEAIVCAVLPHGEHGAIVRLLTPRDGLQPGYVRGGRSRRLRPVLLPGNIVAAEYRARTEAQLAALTVELVRSRAGLLGEPLPAAAIAWVTALTATVLPEGQPYPAIHAALDGLLAAVELAGNARAWGAALARFELLVLAELGFGLDLASCAATGARDDLAYVSPRTGCAVSRGAGAPHAARLFVLPPFLIAGGAAQWPEVREALAITGHFLMRDLLGERRAIILPARTRLLDRIDRLVG